MPSIATPIGVNGFSPLPPQTNGQPASETIYTNGIHPYPGTALLGLGERAWLLQGAQGVLPIPGTCWMNQPWAPVASLQGGGNSGREQLCPSLAAVGQEPFPVGAAHASLAFSGLFYLPSPFSSLPSSKPHGGRPPPAGLRRHAALCRSQTSLPIPSLSPLFAPCTYFWEVNVTLGLNTGLAQRIWARIHEGSSRCCAPAGAPGW